MADKLDPKETVTIEELAISNMWENAALVELLDRKGIVTKEEILAEIQTLRRKTPRAESLQQLSSTLLPEAKADILIKHVLDTLNATGCTAEQAKDLLRHLEALVELGQRIAHKTAH